MLVMPIRTLVIPIIIEQPTGGRGRREPRGYWGPGLLGFCGAGARGSFFSDVVSLCCLLLLLLLSLFSFAVSPVFEFCRILQNSSDSSNFFDILRSSPKFSEFLLESSRKIIKYQEKSGKVCRILQNPAESCGIPQNPAESRRNSRSSREFCGIRGNSEEFGGVRRNFAGFGN